MLFKTGASKGLMCLLAAAFQVLPRAVAQQPPGLSAWTQIHALLSHPRCANCHVDDQHPRWSGKSYGRPRPHAMYVARDETGHGNAGMRCATCHGNSNAAVEHGPPGAPGWHLAPATMAWFDKPSAEICAQVKDKQRNGGRSLQEVAEHVRTDALVAWGWAPGPGRKPAPGSAEQTFRLFEEWIAAGAPCPPAAPAR